MNLSFNLFYYAQEFNFLQLDSNAKPLGANG